MGFIDDKNRVVFKQKVSLNFFKQNSIRHKLNLSLILVKVCGIVPYLIADHASDLCFFQLF